VCFDEFMLSYEPRNDTSFNFSRSLTNFDTYSGLVSEYSADTAFRISYKLRFPSIKFNISAAFLENSASFSSISWYHSNSISPKPLFRYSFPSVPLNNLFGTSFFSSAFSSSAPAVERITPEAHATMFTASSILEVTLRPTSLRSSQQISKTACTSGSSPSRVTDLTACCSLQRTCSILFR
jgi:hypothetical protein